MNIQTEKKSEQLQILTVEICKEDYAEKVEKALKKQRKVAQVPGFRPGNAPMPLIKKTYEKSFIAEEVNQMMMDELNKFVRDNKIEMLGEPLPVNDKTVVDFEHPEKFVFTFEIANQLPFEIDYQKLPEITAYEIVADDEEIDAQVDDLRKRHGKYSAPDTISDSDFVTVEFGENNNGNFYANDLSKAGKKLFLNKNKDEVVSGDINTLFDDENKLATFLKTTPELLEKDQPNVQEMTIKYIGHLEPAELNEEFFKTAFPDGSVTTVEQLRKEVGDKIAVEYAQQSQRKFMNDAIGALVDNVKVELPEDFLRRYILYAQEDMTEEKLNEEFEKYLNSFRWQLIENKLTKENDIKVTEEDIKNYVHDFFLKNYFAQFKPEDVKDRIEALAADTLKNKETVKNIYDQLFDDAIGKALLKQMKTKSKKVTFKQFADELYGIKEEGKEKKAPAKKATAKKAAPKKAAAAKEEAPAETEKPKAKKAAPKAKKTTPKAE
ncbi:MAG: hypothetical protein II757_02360 [Bacteroidales bacterium]|nr:hypothetical protein [Bacteroidales bacterium]